MDTFKNFRFCEEDHQIQYSCIQMWNVCLGSQAGANWDYRSYLATTRENDKTPFLKMPGFELQRVLFDELHDIWLGWCKDFTGQLLFDFASDAIEADPSVGVRTIQTISDGLWTLWVDYLEYRNGRVSIPCFTTNTISWNSYTCYPRLADRIKGAWCNKFLPNCVLWPLGFLTCSSLLCKKMYLFQCQCNAICFIICLSSLVVTIHNYSQLVQRALQMGSAQSHSHR